MKVRYIYSACVVIETPDVKICCDPWFTPGAYDGSWYQYPPLSGNAVDIIGEVDWIYISHIHPDHYDKQFLQEYLERYPGTCIVIGKTTPPYLANKIKVDGFKCKVITDEKIGLTTICIVTNNAYEHDNIDTALVVSRDNQSVVNLNDNPFDDFQIEQILSICPNRKPTFALLPYCGAGPYPQTYHFDNEKELELAAFNKQEQFLNIYTSYIDALQPVRAMPFAGKYFLGGPLSKLNSYRGIPDATLTLERNPDVSLVLEDGGYDSFDLSSLTATSLRTKPYDSRMVEEYLEILDFSGYSYEKEIQPLLGRALPLVPLVNSAYAKNISQSRIQDDYWLCFAPSKMGGYIAVNANRNSTDGVKILSDVSRLEPRCEIFIDDRYLFGLLTRLHHWNNAEIGSQYKVKRVPDLYNREVYNFLNKFHV
jgi:UDP-MurNAc hydroxylase